MKLNGTPRHYMPLSQNQSDEEDNGAAKELKCAEKCCKSSQFSDSLDKRLDLPNEVPVVDKKYVPMSLWRVSAFLFSLLMCFVFISAFLILLPCRPEALGVGNIGDLIEKWTVILPNMSISSNVALAVTSHLSSPLLLFGYSSWENSTYSSKGIIALRKSDGAQVWRLPLHSEPTSVLCNAVDVNNDGTFECLISGGNGLLTAVDTRKGASLWYLHSHKDVRLASSISDPAILPDCDQDEIPDLAISSLTSTEKAVFLLLISGGTGEVIGSPVPLLHCTSNFFGRSAMNRNRTAFIFYCLNGNVGRLFLSYIKDICDVALNKTDVMRLTEVYRLPNAGTLAADSGFQLISTSYSEMIVLFGGSNAVLLVPAVSGKFKVRWQKSFKDRLVWRFLTYGSFLKSSSSELVFVSLNNSISQVVGLDLDNGHELWSSTFNNSIVTSVFPVPKFFRDVDGLILKLLKPAHGFAGKLKLAFCGISSEHNSSNVSNEETDCYFQDNSYQSTEESFILVHVKDLPRAKIISLEEIWQNCRVNSCYPDIYSWKKTAVAEILNTGEVDVSMISASAVPRNISVFWEARTSVKLLKIEKFSKFSKCMYSLDS